MKVKKLLCFDRNDQRPAEYLQHMKNPLHLHTSKKCNAKRKLYLLFNRKGIKYLSYGVLSPVRP